MKKLLLTTITLTAIGVAVKVIKDVEELKFKTSSNVGKLSTRPGLSEVDRLDLRINQIEKSH